MALLEGLPLADYSGPAVLAFIALLVITRRLVWHTDLKKAQARADKLEEMVWSALGVADKAVTSNEITHDVISKLPDPASPGGP